MAAEVVTRYCRCGGTLRGRSTPAAAARTFGDLFDRVHTGEGHGPATARQAAAARRREENETRG